MSFVCTLDPDEDLDVDVIEANGEFIARLAIGYDSETDKTFSLAVALSPVPGAYMELSFSVVGLCQTSGDWSDFWDGLATKPLFPLKEDRSVIRAALMGCVAMLVDVVRPEIVSMSTHTANLPKLALAKFWEVNRIFADRGYRAGRADSYHGRYVWMMRRESSL